MSYIWVNILPAVTGRGPNKFCTRTEMTPKKVICLLVTKYGPGVLKNTEGVTLPPHSTKVLEAGEYSFTVCTATQG